MNPSTVSVSVKPAQSHTRRLLVRMNSTLFHCLGAAVLLEHAAGDHSEPRRERARWLQAYAATVWPEYRWEAASAAVAAILPAHAVSAGRGSVAAIAARDQVAMFYDALSRIAEDPALSSALADMAAMEHEKHMMVDHAATGGAMGALRGAHAVHAYIREARNRVLRCAFHVLQQHWGDTPPFAAVDYDTFLSRAYVLLAPHLKLDWTRRLLYRGWLPSAAGRLLRASCAALATSGAATMAVARTSAPACGLPRATVVR
ncbi:MAG: hypothetical protein ACM3SS_12075 [Rhodospirillaceae bacterium]